MPAKVAIADYFSSSKAFLIGIGNYAPPIQQLTSPAGDAARLRQVLTTLHGFTTAELLLDPGKQELLAFLDRIQASENDRVVIYFAGHGIAIDDETPRGYLLPADAKPQDQDSFIPMDTLMDALGKLPCRHLLLILDCCYAGSFRWSRKTRGLGSDVPKTIYLERFEQYAKHKAWQVLTSSAYDQRAIDVLRLGSRETAKPEIAKPETANPTNAKPVNANRDNNSPYMQLLCNALETGAADLSYGNAPPDGIITAGELNFYLAQEIFRELAQAGIDAGSRQVPQLFPLPRPDHPFDDKGEFLFLNPNLKDRDNAVPLRPQTNQNPYKGLDSYGSADGKLFYGRQRVLDGWDDHPGLIQIVEQYALIIVTGPSGIGKSSLIRAGLSSVLTTELIDIRPGKTPASTHQALLNDLKATKRKTILVDQYEEVLTLCDSKKERDDFAALLQTLLANHTVILTVRSDFENQFRNTTLFAPGGSDKKIVFLVPPFLRSEIREIVILPAVQETLEFKSLDGTPECNTRFEDRIIDDSFQYPGSLPLLSLALAELYNKKEDRSLLEHEYNNFGGINGILDEKATAEFLKVKDDPQGAEAFRFLIFRMIAMEGGRIARKRVYTSLNNARGEDELIFPDAIKTEKIKAIAGTLVKARLLRSDRDENDLPYIEPAHDALLRSWPLLLEWLKGTDADGRTEQSKLLLHKAVSDIALVYANARKSDRQRSREYLWVNDPRLSEVDKTLRSRLNETETAFLQDSLSLRTRNKRQRAILIIAAITVLVAGSIVLYQQSVRNLQQAKRTQALGLLQLASAAEPTEGVNLLKTAYQKDSTDNDILSGIITASEYTRGVNALVQKRIDFDHAVSSLLYLNDSTFAAAGQGGYLLLQTPAGPRSILINEEEGYPEIAFTPDSNHIWAYANGDEIKEYDWQGKLLDSLYADTENDNPVAMGRLEYLPGPDRLYVLLDGRLLSKKYAAHYAAASVDTVYPPDGTQKFTAMDLYKNGTALLLATDHGALLSLDSGSRQPKLLRKFSNHIALVAACHNDAIAMEDRDTGITVLDRSLHTINRLNIDDLKAGYIEAIQPFRHSPKLMIRFGTEAGRVIIWNYQDNKQVIIDQPDSWDNADISPSETSVLTCGGTEINIHDTTGRLLFHYNTSANRELSFVQFTGTDNRFFAVSSVARNVFFWRLDSSSLYRYQLTFQLGDVEGHFFPEPANFNLQKQIDEYIRREHDDSLLYKAALSSNGHWCVYNWDGRVYCYKGAGVMDSFTIKIAEDEPLNGLGFTCNSDSLIAFGNRGTVTIGPIGDQEKFRTLVSLGTLNESQWDQDSGHWFTQYTMASTFGYYDLNGHKIDTGSLIAQNWSLTGGVAQKLCYASSDTIVIRSLTTGKETRTAMPDFSLNNVVLSPLGGYLAYTITLENSIESIQLYSVKNDKPDRLLHSYAGGRDAANRITALKFSADEHTFFVRYANRTIVDFLTPKGARQWIDTVRCAPLPENLKTQYGINQ